MTGPKETVYDEQIAPPVSQIIAICAEHKINYAANFCLDVSDDPDSEHYEKLLKCSTAIVRDEEDEEGAKLTRELSKVMKPPAPSFMAFTIHGGSN